MKVDLSKMSLKQLEAHAGRLQDLVSTLRAKEGAEILQRWKAQDEATTKRRRAEAESLGVDYADVIGMTLPAPAKRRRKRRTRVRKSKGKPKFQDPESGLTWTGRGRVPGWVASHEQGGGSRDDLLIKTDEVVSKTAAKARKVRKRRPRKSKGQAKFQDPESGLTWTGRGRVPGWVASHEQGGGSRDDLLIKTDEVVSKTAAKPRKARRKRSRKKK